MRYFPVSVAGSPFSLRVGSSRSRRHKEGTPPIHGKTRSFDTDYSFGRAGSSSPFGKHLSSGSASFDATNTSRSASASSTNKYKTMESRETSSSFKQQQQDSTDAVHSRLKYGERHPGPPTSSELLSSKLYSAASKLQSSSENLTSASALKSISESTRMHHNSSLLNSSSSSAMKNTSNSNATTLHEQFEKSTAQQYSSAASFGALNGNGHGSYHGDLVVDGDGLGVVLINSIATVTITSEFGQTSLDNINVEVAGNSLIESKIP
jgi:hypothetical protein